ncbi:MAG: bifunctional D-glycero-beta-D-manno-heptose-7-phosphate kinase/D-glycero-beta-D-manno-heptose 1-phosphate adenylyltransferase HldE [Proteobacteria bacterium]|nr:bifunctional D-glycero-beta-D-manno-heptose-7-phosphate kinase/D-glycero-beta-D-manno-heptose 1-phosphate adenylyltransferase HldE [Pseudomonadota bacterium]
MKIRIPEFSRGRVMVIGDLMLDRYWHGGTTRISPEAPVPVVSIGEVEQRAGGAGNVALNIASLDGAVELLALVGDDEPASVLQTLLDDAQVSCHLVALEGRRTITKLRVMSRHQQLIRLDIEDVFSTSDSEQLAGKFQQQLDGCDVVVLSDYGKGTLSDIPELIALARAADKAVLVDPKGSNFSIYKDATMVTPNQAEFESVVGPCATESEFMAKGDVLRSELNLDGLLVTRSDKGMVLFERDAEPFIQATRAREVYDVTGAGDTVIATLAAALAADCNLVEATQLANLAAGIVVRKMGTATTSIEEIQSEMLKHTPLERGVTDEATLLESLKEAKAAGEKIVMTNGCFDILHAGHVAYLARAAELGDRLIVAINTDESVKRLKGDDRPINNVLPRMAVISALESVDWVVPFSEDTPARLIEQCLPDILVKGGDYQVDEIAGGQAVLANGGEVRILDLIDGLSTSAVIEAIKKKV